MLSTAALVFKFLEARPAYFASLPGQRPVTFPSSSHSRHALPLDLRFSICNDQMTSQACSTLTHPCGSQPGKEFPGLCN